MRIFNREINMGQNQSVKEKSSKKEKKYLQNLVSNVTSIRSSGSPVEMEKSISLTALAPAADTSFSSIESSDDVDVNKVVEVLMRKKGFQASLKSVAKQLEMLDSSGQGQLLSAVADSYHIFTINQTPNTQNGIPVYEVFLRPKELRVCQRYNKSAKKCSQESCPYIHVCERYLYRKCSDSANCVLNHDLTTEHNLKIFESALIKSKNKSTLKKLLVATLERQKETHKNHVCSHTL